LRICSSNDSFEKKYYEQILPNQEGINIAQTLADSLAVCGVLDNNKQIKEELDKLSLIAQE
jgi:hypothetical protein